MHYQAIDNAFNPDSRSPTFDCSTTTLTDGQENMGSLPAHGLGEQRD